MEMVFDQTIPLRDNIRLPTNTVLAGLLVASTLGCEHCPHLVGSTRPAFTPIKEPARAEGPPLRSGGDRGGHREVFRLEALGAERLDAARADEPGNPPGHGFVEAPPSELAQEHAVGPHVLADPARETAARAARSSAATAAASAASGTRKSPQRSV